MIQIKIYNKTFVKLATFVQQDFTGLQHQRSKGEIGDASFTINLNRGKMSDTNLALYNRIKIVDDGVVKFTGMITQKIVKLDTAEIRCRELPFILKKRLVGDAYTLSGSINDVITTLMTGINASEDTGILIGTLSGIGTVNLTFNSADVWTILKQICDATGNQFEVKDRTLMVAPQIGTDKSASILLRYNVDQIANANLTSFEVEDDGENIITKSYGKSDALVSTQVDAVLQGKYGTLERFKDFRVVNTQGVLDEFASYEISDRIYSPKLNLKPNVLDNFEMGDTVQIKLKNPLISINDAFQVLQKTVKINGDQKIISIRINDLPNALVQKLADRDRRLELLEKQV